MTQRGPTSKTLSIDHQLPGHSGAGLSEQWIRVGWLIDGRNRPPQPDMLLCVQNGRISFMATFAQATQSEGLDLAPFDPLDLTHATVIPTLVDAHVHLALDPEQNINAHRPQPVAAPDKAMAAIARRLQDYLISGVRAVRDGGDHRGNVLAFKNDLFRNSRQCLIHLAASGHAWHASGRYGRLLGRTPPKGKTLAEALTEANTGADHVKLIQSGINSLQRFAHPTPPQFTLAQLRTAVLASHRKDLSVMVHANGCDPVQVAVQAGCDSIEHGYFMGTENLQRMAGQGVYWVPTAVPMAMLAKSTALSVSRRDVARRTLDHQLAQISKAHQMGLRMALGTDAGSPGVGHGRAVYQELALWMTAGISLESAVSNASHNGACLLGKEGDHGVLDVGRRADMVVLPGSPEALSRHLPPVEAVCINGLWIQQNHQYVM